MKESRSGQLPTVSKNSITEFGDVDIVLIFTPDIFGDGKYNDLMSLIKIEGELALEISDSLL